jgi:RpiB/LacA/LacB family sugar-phosphate isomerase
MVLRAGPGESTVKIIIGSDYGGLTIKKELADRLIDDADIVVHCDPVLNRLDNSYAVLKRMAALLLTGEAERGIFLCVNGYGATMDANKQPGVRAALCQDQSAARDRAYEDNMNLLVMDPYKITSDAAFFVATSFLSTYYRNISSSAGMPLKALSAVVEYIRSHLDQPLDIGQLASLVRMSSSHFSKLFKMSLGVTPHQFVLRERIDRSKELLRHTNIKIVEIAFRVGFETQAHFTTVFGYMVGDTPRNFRRRVTMNIAIGKQFRRRVDATSSQAQGLSQRHGNRIVDTAAGRTSIAC